MNVNDAAGGGQGTPGAGAQGDAGLPADGSQAAGAGAGQGQQPAGQGQQTPQGGQGGQPQPGTTGQQGSQQAAFDPLTHEFQAPEGVELDQSALGVFRPLAKELGLDAQTSQKLVEGYTKIMQQQADAFIEVQKQWVEQIKSDTEVGGANFEQSKQYAQAAVDWLGMPAIKDLLNQSGYGNNPEFFRAFVKIGKLVAPDKVEIGGRNPVTQGDDVAKTFFPTMN